MIEFANQLTAWPLADAALSQEILDLIQSSTQLRQAKKGANEGMSSFAPTPIHFATFN
jgi:U4/U6 small nuclear ribonucleoprotein SNU13